MIRSKVDDVIKKSMIDLVNKSPGKRENMMASTRSPAQ